MNQEFTHSADAQKIEEDWKIVESCLFTAIKEVALSIGGKDLVKRVNQEATLDCNTTHIDALRLLEKLSPGAAEAALKRAEEIQEEICKNEVRALTRSAPKRFGRAILKSFVDFGAFGARRTR